MKTKSISKILIIILSVIVATTCLIVWKNGDIAQNPVQKTQVSSLPKGVAINDIEIVYLCKTAYGQDDEAVYKKKDLYDEEAQSMLKGIAQLVSDNDCTSFDGKVQEEGLQYNYLIQGYNAESYIEFRIEVYVYGERTNKETVVIYEKLEDYYNPDVYILDNDKATKYIMKYMDEIKVDKE